MLKTVVSVNYEPGVLSTYESLQMTIIFKNKESDIREDIIRLNRMIELLEEREEIELEHDRSLLDLLEDL